MGTSTSSTGAPSSVPMTPPWTPDPIPPSDDQADGGDDGGSEESQGEDVGQATPSPVPLRIAPQGRFGPARRSLGSFARTGSRMDMRRGIGHYFRKGLGGSRSASRRFGGTARTAATLYRALSSAAAGRPFEPDSPLDPDRLAGRSARDVMDAVVEAVRPVDGTQDAEASRQAVNEGLSDLLDRYPDADLLNLDEDQRLFVIERFIAQDVYNRLILDVGKSVQEKAADFSAALLRMRQIKDYIRETISARFRAMRATASALSPRSVAQMATRALVVAFTVFEEYIQ